MYIYVYMYVYIYIPLFVIKKYNKKKSFISLSKLTFINDLQDCSGLC